MKHDLIEHTAQYIAVTLCVCGSLHRLRDGTAQTSSGSGVALKDLPAMLNDDDDDPMQERINEVTDPNFEAAARE